MRSKARAQWGSSRTSVLNVVEDADEFEGLRLFAVVLGETGSFWELEGEPVPSGGFESAHGVLLPGWTSVLASDSHGSVDRACRALFGVGVKRGSRRGQYEGATTSSA